MNRLTCFVIALSFSGLAAGCSTKAKDAASFWESSAENSCYITKKCQKWNWNEQEYKNIQDCVDEILDDFSGEDFEDICPDYDEDKGKDCLKQMIGEYNSCTPAHDYDDADFDPEDDPCREVCGNQAGTGQGYLPHTPWIPDEQ